MKRLITILFTLFIMSGSVFADTPIKNKPTSTEEQCEQWMIDNNVEEEFIALIPYIYERSETVGIDPTVIVTQAALETAYFTSYNLRSNHNTAGIKDRQNMNKYAYYETYKDGFDAQINHLALYAGIPQKDYYYASKLDGWVVTVEGLSGTWAEDTHYANKILSMMETLQNYEYEKETTKEKTPTKTTEKDTKNDAALSIIKNVLSRTKQESKAARYLLNFNK